MCIVACPYGRLQSVLLDKQSLIVGYDAARGEPRGKVKKRLTVLDQPRGDCVDCSACVSVCPTGIDIRNGLQMECIGCAQCIDACDAVMDKLERRRGLIGYTSQERLAGKRGRLLRARTVIYPALLALVAGLFVVSIGSKSAAEVFVQRTTGPSFVVLPDGKIASQILLKIENETDEPKSYTVTLAETPNATLRSPQARWQVKPRKAIDVPVFVDSERGAFVHGKRTAHVRIDDSTGFQKIVTVTLLGPEGSAP
jgi:cytochrome c oxidase accessory protein FixG